MEVTRTVSSSGSGFLALILISTIALFFTPAHAISQEKDDLDEFFEEAFGIPAEAQETPVEIRIGERSYGDATAMVTPGGTLEAFDAESLLEQLRGLLNDAGRQAVEEVAEEGLVPVDLLSEQSITTEYDRSSLTARLRVPGEYRQTQQLRVRSERGRQELPEDVPVHEPSVVSGGLPVAGSATHSSATDGASRWTGDLRLTPFVSAWSWTLQSGVALAFGEHGVEVEPATTNLKRFWPEQELLLTIGDITPATSMFQSVNDLEGVGVSRSVERDGIIGDPLTEFSLEERGDVEVAINDRVAFRETLGPGTYELTDVPVRRGVNELEVRFPDSSVEPRSLSLPWDSGLVPEGEHEFSHAAGVTPFLLETDTSAEALNANSFRLGSFHRYGFTPTFTAGGGLQASAEVAQVSAGANSATALGNVGVATAVSAAAGSLPGFGFNLSYGLFLPGVEYRPSLRVTAGWFGSTLSDPERRNGRGGRPLQFSADYGQGIGGGFSGTLRTALQHDPLDNTTGYNVSMGVNSPRLDGVRVATRVGYQSSSDNPSGWSGLNGYVSLRFSPASGTSVSTRQQLTEPRNNINLTNSGTIDGAGRYRASADVAQQYGRRPPVERVGGQLGLSGRRGSLNARVGAGFDGEGESSTRLRFGAESGILFASDSFAWARVPEDESFVIVSLPGEDGELESVRVNGPGGALQVTPGLFGAVVVSGAEPYEPLLLNLVPDALPLGYELAESRSAAATGLRTGTAIEPALEGRAFARGYAVEREGDGEPVALAAGQLYAAGDEDASTLVFTNEQGRFEARGLTSGDYVIEFANGRGRLEFTIPEDASGLYELGEVALEAGNGNQEGDQ